MGSNTNWIRKMSPIHRNVCLSLRWNWTSVSSPFFFLFNIWDIYRVERNPLNLLVANVAIFGSISIYISLPSMLRVFCLFMGRITARFAHTRGWSEIKGSWWQIIKTLGMIKLHILRLYQAQSHQRRDEYKQGTTDRHGAIINGTVPH